MTDDMSPEEYQAQVRKLRAELKVLRGGGDGAEVASPTPPLRQRDILRALLTERQARAASLARATVRLARNAKGDVQPEVMVEVSDESPAAAIAAAQSEATRVFDALCLVYSLDTAPPPVKGHGGKGGNDD